MSSEDSQANDNFGQSNGAVLIADPRSHSIEQHDPSFAAPAHLQEAVDSVSLLGSQLLGKTSEELPLAKMTGQPGSSNDCRPPSVALLETATPEKGQSDSSSTNDFRMILGRSGSLAEMMVEQEDFWMIEGGGPLSPYEDTFESGGPLRKQPVTLLRSLDVRSIRAQEHPHTIPNAKEPVPTQPSSTRRFPSFTPKNPTANNALNGTVLAALPSPGWNDELTIGAL